MYPIVIIYLFFTNYLELYTMCNVNDHDMTGGQLFQKLNGYFAFWIHKEAK